MHDSACLMVKASRQQLQSVGADPSLSSDWGTCRAVAGTDGERLLRPVSRMHPSWSGLPMMLTMLPADAEAVDLTVLHPSLAVARSGRGKRRYASGSHVRDLYSSPAMFELYEEGYCVDHALWQGVPGEVLGIQFPSTLVNRLLHAEGAGFRLPTRLEQFDPRLTTLAELLWEEAANGGKRGKLYAEGLSLALLGLLMEEHGALGRADARSRPRLANSARVLIRDYIEQHFAAELSVDHLAALLQMSPAHFSRAFKETFGSSPHAYVMDRRISAARLILRAERSRSLAEVAASLGFSSQSHFTEAFKRRMGVTPGRWRVE